MNTIQIQPKTPTSTLVEIYNALAQRPVKKFASRAAALKRVNEALSTSDKRVPAQYRNWIIVGKQDPAPEQEAPVQDDSPEQIEAAEALKETLKKAPKKGKKASKEKDPAKGKAPKKEAKAKSTNGKSGRTSAYSGKGIYRLKAENPRRKDTFGWRSWNVITEDGMLYEDYLKAGGRRKDLAWDIAAGHAEVR